MTIAPSRLRPLAERLLFAVAISASAFLLFLVQPIVGKRILPWFGGAPGVWTLCLAFYQSTLFIGYGCAHLLIRFASPGLQVGVYALAAGFAILVLPVLPGEVWQPRERANPSGEIIAMLTANVALPFLVLASTGPLLQAWFARRHPQRSPYPLYAFSNAGSLAALLAYPFVIEPRFALSQTGDFWSFAFALAACAVLGSGALGWQGRLRAGAAATLGGAAGPGAAGSITALWFLLSAAAVVLLMGITNKLCIDIASVPFLWILPLATYLVTFVVCFASEATYRRAPCVFLALLALVPSVGSDVFGSWVENATRIFFLSPPVQIASFCVLLFAVCMILHGELYRLRPPAGALTAFYLAVSGGGALGGIFVGILAPMLFDDYHEISIGLGLAFLLLLTRCANDPASMLHSSAPRWRWVAVGASTLLLLGYTGLAGARPSASTIHQERSFFGVHRVLESTVKGRVLRSLKNGTTTHGVQLMGPHRELPTSYYGRATGLGLVLGRRDPVRDPVTESRVGVVGLGIGTVAAYAQEGDVIRFYEIDPVVVRIARDDGFFHYLEDSAADVEIVVGDARLSIANEQLRGAPQSFDVLVVDAFNSDAIPVHLLTVEAFAHYALALAPGGLLAVHASSRDFELMPLVTRVGLELGLHSLEIVNERANDFQSKPSQWVWLSRDAEHIRELENRVRRQHESLGLAPGALRLRRAGAPDVSHVPVFTDDYSDLFSLLRRRGGPSSGSTAAGRFE